VSRISVQNEAFGVGGKNESQRTRRKKREHRERFYFLGMVRGISRVPILLRKACPGG
jgi:hypothetical protein